MKTLESCRNCRRLLEWVDGIGWMHIVDPAIERSGPFTCHNPHPGCMVRKCDHADEPVGLCPCTCHRRTEP